MHTYIQPYNHTCIHTIAYTAGSDLLSKSLRTFVHGRGSSVDMIKAVGGSQADSAGSKNDESWGYRSLVLAFLVLGLQGSYIVWGILQEQMMTQAYGTSKDGEPIHFTNSQYLVFLNRALAFITAMIIVNISAQPRTAVPLYKYSFPSMSNILSSWCQYEALKYVSFPTQVLAKASKTIPVMLMGKIVEGKSYPPYEYVCAAVMSLGVSMFFFSRAGAEGGDEDDQSTTVTGLTMLLGYMVFDRCILQPHFFHGSFSFIIIIIILFIIIIIIFIIFIIIIIIITIVPVAGIFKTIISFRSSMSWVVMLLFCSYETLIIVDASEICGSAYMADPSNLLPAAGSFSPRPTLYP